MEKTPEEIPCEEDWDAVATDGIQSIVGIELAEEADELEEEEIDIELSFTNGVNDVEEASNPEEEARRDRFKVMVLHRR